MTDIYKQIQNAYGNHAQLGEGAETAAGREAYVSWFEKKDGAWYRAVCFGVTRDGIFYPRGDVERRIIAANRRLSDQELIDLTK